MLSYEVERLFQKQAQTEKQNEEQDRKTAEKWNREEQLRKKLQRNSTGDLFSQEKRWRSERKRQNIAARLATNQIQKQLRRQRIEKKLKLIKQGVLEGAIEIREVPDGFEIISPPEKVAEYIFKQLKMEGRFPDKTDLEKGKFLLGTVDDMRKESVRLLRTNLIEEFEAEKPSDLMLVDVAVSNYVRCMYATGMENDCLWHTDHSMEMFEVMAGGLQPYIHACQNQFLKSLQALRARKHPCSTYSHVSYSRTDINLQEWGLPLLYALRDVTIRKETDIGLDEIKQAMKIHAQGFDVESIENNLIGYVLERYGFHTKTHTSTGNRYNITREQVQAVLKALKA